MLVQRLLRARRAHEQELGQRGRAEQCLGTEHNLSRDEAPPGRTRRLVCIEGAGQRNGEIIVRHDGGKPTVEVRLELVGSIKARDVVKLLLELGFEGPHIEPRYGCGEIPASHEPAHSQRLHVELIAPDKVERIAEHERVARPHLVGADVARLRQRVDEGMPVVQVEHEIEGATERGKVLGSRLERRFLCLEISPAKNLVGITQATPLEPHAHRGANDMRRRDGHERVVRGALCGRMTHGAELLYALPHGRFVDRKQGHDEVILLKRLPLRVHTHKDVRYGLLVSRFGNLQRRQKIALKPE